MEWGEGKSVKVDARIELEVWRWDVDVAWGQSRQWEAGTKRSDLEFPLTDLELERSREIR